MAKRAVRKLFVVLIVIASIVFLVYFYVSTRNYVKTEAVVTAVMFDSSASEDDEEYLVISEYTVEGTTYKAELHAREGKYSVGDRVEISYDPKNPNNNAMGRMNLPILIAVCVGVLIVGFIVIVKI